MAKAMSLMCTNNLYLTQNLCWLCFRWFRWRIRKLGQYHYINFFVLFRLFCFSFLHLHCILGSWSEIDSKYRFCWPWPYTECTFLLPYKVLNFKKDFQWKLFNTTLVLLIFYVKLFYLIYEIPGIIHTTKILYDLCSMTWFETVHIYKNNKCLQIIKILLLTLIILFAYRKNNNSHWTQNLILSIKKIR